MLKNLSKHKVVFFFLAFLPQFVDPARRSTLALPRMNRPTVDLFAGTVFAGLALRLLVAQR